MARVITPPSVLDEVLAAGLTDANFRASTNLIAVLNEAFDSGNSVTDWAESYFCSDGADLHARTTRAGRAPAGHSPGGGDGFAAGSAHAGPGAISANAEAL